MSRTMLVLSASIAGIVAVGVAGFVVLAWRGEIEPLTPQAAEARQPDADIIAAGERIALLGNCQGCHTAPGGAMLAGGLPIATPFGAIHTTNITPDHATGIGAWSFEAYERAMRDGVDRQGRHLYPAFPYEYFTAISDADMQALYAWNMAQPAVSATAPDNDLPFPLGFRPLLAGWKLLYHRNDRFSPNESQSPQWNVGAYLAEGLGHCGACHTPRGPLGGTDRSDIYGGGEAHGWHAPALTAANPALTPWTEQALFSYLRTGRSDDHGVAAGPMASVVHDSLALTPEEDVSALAVYFADLMAPPDASSTLEAGEASRRDAGYGVSRAAIDSAMPPMGTTPPQSGGQLFASNCASCHHSGGPGGGPPWPRLHATTTIAGPDARNLVQVILWGIGNAEGSGEDYMPRFAEELDDREIAAIATWLRTYGGQGTSTALSNRPGRRVDPALVSELRDGGPIEGQGAGPLSGFRSTSSGAAAPLDQGATP